MAEIIIDIDIPEGYEATGECRHAEKGEEYLNRNGQVQTWLDRHPTTQMYIILRKVDPKWIPEPGDVLLLVEGGCRYHRIFSHFDEGDGTLWASPRFDSVLEEGKPCCWGHIQYFKAEPTEVISLERPRYKSFKIDWNTYSTPRIECDEGNSLCWLSAQNGQKIGDYRIIRFGNNPAFHIGDASMAPSYPSGNFKYAYGRLEA